MSAADTIVTGGAGTRIYLRSPAPICTGTLTAG
jgi:hypothetical protein